MHYIIDGYNLMKTNPELAMLQRLELEVAREALLKRVGSAAGLKTASQITVVFDGHLSGNTAETVQRRGRIVVIFSKLGETADEVIKRLVRQSVAPEVIKVITQDWEIKDSITAGGASSTNITRRPSIKSKNTKNTAEDEAEDKGWNASTRKKGPSKRAPKRQRKPGSKSDIYW